MPMNSDRLIIGYRNINNAFCGDCKKMLSFFFFFLAFNLYQCFLVCWF